MRILLFLPLFWSCASREARVVEREGRNPVTVASESVPSVLPEEGSVCEFERGTPIEEVEFPVYTVYSVEQLQEGFSEGTTYVFAYESDQERMGIYSRETWTVLSTTDEELEIRIVLSNDSVGPDGQGSLVRNWFGSWHEFAARWSFDSNRSQVRQTQCEWGDAAVSGLEIRHQEPMTLIGLAYPETEHNTSLCFSENRALPPILQEFQDGDERFWQIRLLTESELSD